jgi:hypothetical protein
VKQQIQIWGAFVTRLMEGWYSKDDMTEIDIALANRKHITTSGTKLWAEEEEILANTDREFRERGSEALQASGLLDEYRALGAGAPADEWWWHL